MSECNLTLMSLFYEFTLTFITDLGDPFILHLQPPAL